MLIMRLALDNQTDQKISSTQLSDNFVDLLGLYAIQVFSIVQVISA